MANPTCYMSYINEQESIISSSTINIIMSPINTRSIITINSTITQLKVQSIAVSLLTNVTNFTMTASKRAERTKILFLFEDPGRH